MNQTPSPIARIPAMVKKRFFLILLIAIILLIFLQQNSLTPSNNHLVESNATHTNKIVPPLNHTAIATPPWSYKKLIHSLSKSDLKEISKNKSWLNGFNPLKHFPVYGGRNVTRVLLLAYFRSGSTFVADLLQQNWKSFYSFEPLFDMTRSIRLNDANLTQSLNLITEIFTCNLGENWQHTEWASTPNFYTHNKFLWSLCRFRPTSCVDPSFVQQTCKRSKYNIIKSVRLSMKHMQILWKQLASLNIKIIYLVRDPRGIYNSRKRMEWCNKEKACASIENICAEIRQDLYDYDRLKPAVGENLALLRYEDISRDPLGQSRSLFAQLKIDLSGSVLHFIRTHTKTSQITNLRARAEHDPYSTYRLNSTATASQWMHRLNSSEIEFAQQNCSDILARLHYPFL